MAGKAAKGPAGPAPRREVGGGEPKERSSSVFHPIPQSPLHILNQRVLTSEQKLTTANKQPETLT